MPKHTPEQKRAKQALANAKAKVRDFMIKGKVAEATAHAEKHGFKLFDARLAPEYQSPAEPAFKTLEEAQKPVTFEEWEGIEIVVDALPVPEGTVITEYVSAPEPTHENGWPLKTEAVVYRLVPNPKLVVIQLPDGRQSSMLKGRGVPYRVHKRLHAKLVRTEPEPLYDHLFIRE